MKKIFGNRVVAWVVLVLAVALACFLGFYRKDYFESRRKTELLNVKKNYWVCDSADMLSDEIEESVMEHDRVWEGTYNSVAAVATLPKLNRWTVEEYTESLAKSWGLGENDLILLLVQDDEWYMAAGANINRYLTDSARNDLKYSVSTLHHNGDYDGAVKAFLDWADELISGTHLSPEDESFNLGSLLGSILPFSIGCSTTPLKTILIVIVVIVIISALSKGGRH